VFSRCTFTWSFAKKWWSPSYFTGACGGADTGALAALKNWNLYPFDYHWLSIPGPRLVDGLEQLAKLLHPELFK